jgi:hypothetical protein
MLIAAIVGLDTRSTMDLDTIANRSGIIDRISESNDLQNMWKKYQQRFSYAAGIEYADIMKALRELLL